MTEPQSPDKIRRLEAFVETVVMGVLAGTMTLPSVIEEIQSLNEDARADLYLACAGCEVDLTLGQARPPGADPGPAKGLLASKSELEKRLEVIRQLAEATEAGHDHSVRGRIRYVQQLLKVQRP